MVLLKFAWVDRGRHILMVLSRDSIIRLGFFGSARGGWIKISFLRLRRRSVML